jgi:hypothetical protein
MSLFTYLLQDVLSRQLLGTVDLTGVTFNDPLNTAGSFTGTYTIGITGNPVVDSEVSDFAQLVFCPDQTLIHVIWPATNKIMSSYLLVSLQWNASTNEISLSGTQMQAWLSMAYPENYVTGGQPNYPYVFTNIDQFTIAQSLIQQLQILGPQNGVPPIFTHGNTSGTATSLTITDPYQSDINSLITALAANYNGFDWEIAAEWSTIDNKPQLYLETYSPEKSSGLTTSQIQLFFYSTPNGSNLTSYSPFPIDASNRKNNIILSATTAGGQQFYALWSDGRFGNFVTAFSAGGEQIGNSNTFTPLRRLSIGSVSTNNYDPNTLNSVATTMGNSWSQTCGVPIISHHPANPSVSSYNVGDRCRLRINDPFLEFDQTGVRIVDRSITDEDPNTVASVSVTLDLTDQNNPADGA